MASHSIPRKAPAQFPMQFGNDVPAPSRDVPSSALPAGKLSTNHPLPPLPPTNDSPNRLYKSSSADRPNHRHPSPTRSSQQMNHFYPPTQRDQPPIRPISNHGHPAPSTGSRPTSSNSASQSGYESEGSRGGKKRSSWLPGSRSRSRHPSQEIEKRKQAWIMQNGQELDYTLTSLIGGHKVPELWREHGNALIYLFGSASGRGPSFRIPSHLLSASDPLLMMMISDKDIGEYSWNKSSSGRGQLEGSDRNYGVRDINTPPITPNTYAVDSPRRYEYEEPMAWPATPSALEMVHIFLPIDLKFSGPQLGEEDVQKLIDARNVFAFLNKQPLALSRRCPHMTNVLFRVAGLLRKYEFGNINGSNLGEAASMAFNTYMDLPEVCLSDMRTSREKSIEFLVLAEAMKSTTLYGEAFTHVVGNYDSVENNTLPIFRQISQITDKRITRAVMELKTRKRSVEHRLTSFEFPSLFAGIAASKTRDDAKNIRFAQWKMGFIAMRKFVMSYLTHELYDSWPPRAKSKKNTFSTGGLHRLALKGLYRDMCNLYDMLVDRTAYTTRAYGEAESGQAVGDPVHHALRTILSEYDRSSPPVQPPVPFDIPLVPTVRTVDPSYPNRKPKSQAKETNRKLKSNERKLVLAKSHNFDIHNIKNDKFLDFYKDFEDEQAQGKNSQDLADMRYGVWIFLYAVVQALPMLVVDAPGLKYTDKVEYFLCQPSFGSPPWVEGAELFKNDTYGTGNGDTVSLPAHLVNHGTEAIYQRSHCWVRASEWLGSGSDTASVRKSNTEPDLNAMSPLEPPPGFAGGRFGERRPGRGGSVDDRSSDWNSNFSNLTMGPPGPSSNQLTDEERVARSRNRKSLALGLEKLETPSHYDLTSQTLPASSAYLSGHGSAPSSQITFPSYGSGYPSSAGVPYPSSRTASESSDPHSIDSSVMNGHGVGWRPPSGGRPPTASGGNTGTTFDDILGSIQGANAGTPKGKKLAKKQK